ncbi:MAG: hypothetical protein QXT20_02630 [Candidatus Woesearchaeota archaeon]
MEPEKKLERPIAFKISISEFLNGEYVKSDGWDPNYLVTEFYPRVSKVNIIGVVISNELEQFGEIAYRNIILDDGTGSVHLRNFENPEAFSNINISDTVLVLGKPREYNNERYVLAEIVRKVDPKWLEVRKVELSLRKKAVEGEKEVVEESISESESGKSEMSGLEKVYRLVQELDSGDGAPYDEVIKRAGISDAEEVIRKLLERGDIFEIRTGRLKVL